MASSQVMPWCRGSHYHKSQQVKLENDKGCAIAHSDASPSAIGTRSKFPYQCRSLALFGRQRASAPPTRP